MPKRKLTFMWAGIGFGAVYWIMESIRDVLVFGRGTIFERIFMPDIMTFWRRLPVILILVLYSIYVQSLGDKFEPRGGRIRQLIRRIGIIWMGLIFGLMYWILEAVRDSFVFQTGTLFQEIFLPDPMAFWIRILAIGILVMFSFYIRNLVHERRKAEQILHETNIKLVEVDRLKNEFLSVVSHELRTPLCIMREGVSLCLEEVLGELNDKQKKFLSSTLNNIDRLSRLISDLLNISRIEENKLVIRKSVVDLEEVVKKAVSSLQVYADEKRIHVKTHFPKNKLVFVTDREKVTQIFQNLISNGIRFTKERGKVTVSIKELEDSVQCQVSDTGIGIAKENIPRLFKKFEQFARIEGPGYKGTGLGLAITKGLVDKMGGTIEVRSHEGRGSTFTFTLPKEEFAKILIVDDERAIVNTLKRIFSTEQYQCDAAYDGIEAIDKAQNEKYSLIILDMVMPQMSGYEVIGRLKQDARTCDIPIMIMSGYAVDQDYLNQIDQNTAIPIIAKPIQPDRLKAAVKEILEY